MSRYVLRRLLQVPAVLLVISLIVFSLMHVSPGDPVQLMLGDSYTADDAARLRRTLNLDRPLAVQYLSWVWGAVRLDLGNSLYTLRPIREVILDRAPYTVTLAVLSMALAMFIAVPVGVVSSYRHNTVTDYLSMAGAMVGVSVPNFALSVLLILVLAVWLDLLPISGPGDPLRDPIGSLQFYVMPVAALSANRVAILSRLVRSSMLEALGQDYIRTARAKGLAESAVLFRHALRNALIPVVTLGATSLAYALSGAVAIEFVFGLPGLGSLMLDALSWRDFPLIQGVTFVTALIFVLANLVADVIYAVIDPRIRY